MSLLQCAHTEAISGPTPRATCGAAACASAYISENAPRARRCERAYFSQNKGIEIICVGQQEDVGGRLRLRLRLLRVDPVIAGYAETWRLLIGSDGGADEVAASLSSRQRQWRPPSISIILSSPFSFLSTFIARQCKILFLLLLLFFSFLLQLFVPRSVSRVSPSVLEKSARAQKHAGRFDSSPFAEQAERLHVTLKPQL